MNKKGFVSTSVVLCLFVLFITLMLVLLSNYSSNRKYKNILVDDIKSNFKYDYFNEKYILIDNELFELKEDNIVFSVNNLGISEKDDFEFIYNNILKSWLDNHKGILEYIENEYYFYNDEYYPANYNLDDTYIYIVLKLKSNVSYEDVGTFQNPYRIVGDLNAEDE